MIANDYRLNDQVAIITAGANGIGEGAALGIARFGGDVVIADVDVENGERVAQAVRAMGRQALFIKTDVRHTDQIAAMVDQAAQHFGRIDILVNNAGGTRHQSFLNQNEGNWRRLIDFNFISMLATTQAAAKVIAAGQRGGAIINIASSESLRAAPGFAVYAACKAAMVSFTRSMALELAEHRIRTFALAPDMIETPGLKPFLDTASAAVTAARDRYIPLGRLGSIDEIGNVVVFLASGMASYLTGVTIPVDAGALASSGWNRSPTDGSWGLYHG